jgi:hypothetical protein
MTETKEFVRVFPQGQLSYRPGIGGPSGARDIFWGEFQREILRALHEEYAKGWKPITEVGPSAFVLRTYERGEPITGSRVLMWIFTLGLGILFNLLSPDKTTWIEPAEFRVTLAR